MSRHVVDVGRRSLQFPKTHAVTAFGLTPLRTRLLPNVSPVGPSSAGPLAFLQQNVTARFYHATAQNTSVRWTRSEAPDLRSLPSKAVFTTPSRSSQCLDRGKTQWALQRRWNSDRKDPPEKNAATDAQMQNESLSEAGSHKASKHAASVHDTNKSIYERLPHLHRPTKEELLAAATGFWHRLQIRFKWFSIRSVRPFNHEEIFAFMSWIFWGHVLWFVIGTTTFMSLIILTANTVFAQETLAGWVGNYLTRSTGLKVVFENAIVPKWNEGVIRFEKVFVSRRPGRVKSQRSVTKGSSQTAAAAAAAAAEVQAEKERLERGQVAVTADEEDDGNYSQFDVTIENVEVSLSFAKWFNGKGLLRDVSVNGVRGVIDRTYVQPRPEDQGRDPKSFRHEHNTGDFEIEHFRMQDVLLTIYQPNNFRPFQVSVYDCELPRLRKQWLFYDFLCANTVHGSFDNSLFTIHPRQVHGTTGTNIVDGREEEASQWKKHSRLRIDGLKIDHLNRGVEGPFSWIYEGNVDIVADVMIPNDADGSIAKVMSDFYDRMEATVTQQAQIAKQQSGSANIIDNRDTSFSNIPEQVQQQQQREEDNRFIIFDIQIHLNDVRASVPIFTRDLSYVNNAVVRPIVAYINSHSYGTRNYIPISCRIVKGLSEFDGSWTVFDSGLLNDLSRETYDAFVRDITDRKARQRRIKKVGLWAASVAAQALFIGLAGQLA